MSSSAVVLSQDAKVRINGAVFAVRGGNVEVVSREHDTSDTEGDGFESAKGGLKRLNATLDFQTANDVDYHQAPLSIANGDTVVLEIYNMGLDFDPYACHEFLVLGFTQVISVEGGPITGQIRGRSSGEYLKPGDA